VCASASHDKQPATARQRQWQWQELRVILSRILTRILKLIMTRIDCIRSSYTDTLYMPIIYAWIVYAYHIQIPCICPSYTARVTKCNQWPC
jgi:hypothetical protein